MKEKLFIIDYYFKGPKKSAIKTYMVKSTSRGKAEKECRDMESPDVIAVKSIKSQEFCD